MSNVEVYVFLVMTMQSNKCLIFFHAKPCHIFCGCPIDIMLVNYIHLYSHDARFAIYNNIRNAFHCVKNSITTKDAFSLDKLTRPKRSKLSRALILLLVYAFFLFFLRAIGPLHLHCCLHPPPLPSHDHLYDNCDSKNNGMIGLFEPKLNISQSPLPSMPLDDPDPSRSRDAL